MKRAVEHVVENLDGALDLERLARGAALSPFHFHRIFRGLVGETPLELHRRLRMERAAFTLLEQSSAVTTVAFDSGYDTHEAFTRAFRERYGCSPSEFRQSGYREGIGCQRSLQFEIAARSGIHFQPEPAAHVTVRFVQGGAAMNVEIKKMSELRTVTLRHVGPYNRISEAFGRLGEIAGAAGLLVTRPTMLAIYHDDPETTPEAELRSDAAMTLPEGVPCPAGLVEQRVAGGRYATTTHLGSYETLGDTWARFMGQWLPQSGQRVGDGVTYEIYVNNPTEVEKQDLRTELYIPLA
ncbi:MAG TPA: AraC family transcriptional regulator [Polyangiaceae bacterium]|nr:AraC family transcriptional regulator [Polyangiaceae bacterium]